MNLRDLPAAPLLGTPEGIDMEVFSANHVALVENGVYKPP